MNLVRQLYRTTKDHGITNQNLDLTEMLTGLRRENTSGAILIPMTKALRTIRAEGAKKDLLQKGGKRCKGTILDPESRIPRMKVKSRRENERIGRRRLAMNGRRRIAG